MNFTDEQRAAIETDGADLVVVAGAGSGKTRVLVERYMRLLHECAPEELLAITFTEKAAREMRDRVRDRLERAARAARGIDRERWELRRAQIEAARIGTIHGFCAALLRAHPAETGIDPRFDVLDEVESGLLIAQSADDSLARAVAGGLDPLLEEYGLSELRAIVAQLLRGGGQTRAALARVPPSPEALLGSWRERLSDVRRAAVADMLADPEWRAALVEALALAPSAPSGDRLGEQLQSIEPLLRALAAGDAALAGGLQALGDLKPHLGTAKAWGGREAIEAARGPLRTLRDGYRARETILAIGWDEALEARAARAVVGLAELCRAATAAYDERKDDRDALDFDDLELRVLRLLREHPDVRRAWQDELRAVLVDEFQDTSPEQRDIVYALAGYDERPARGGRLFIVADGKQSVYRFRGADVGVFEQARADIADAGVEIALDRSFRAHARLVALVNHVFAAVMRRVEQTRPYEVAFEPLRQHRPQPAHEAVAEIHVMPRPSKAAPVGSQDAARRLEGRALARRIREMVEGREELVWDGSVGRWRAVEFGDVAMLFQASTVFPHYEEALRVEGVPFLTTAGRGYYGRSEVRDLIHLLRFLDDPGDDFALVGALRSPLFAVDDSALLRLRLSGAGGLWHEMESLGRDATAGAAGPPPSATRILRSLLALRGRVSVVELLRAALHETGYMATVSGLRDGERRRANVEKLLDVARRLGASSLTSFGLYLEDVLRQEAREGEAALEGAGAVRLMTVHRAKGLEFPVVVLPDAGRRPPPARELWLAQRGAGLALKLRDGADWVEPAGFRLARVEEERMERAERTRLAYVALTRAQDYLVVAGQERESSGDDWLSWIVAALDWPWETGGPPDGVHPAAGGALRVAVRRHAAEEPGPPDPVEPETLWDLLGSPLGEG